MRLDLDDSTTASQCHQAPVTSCTQQYRSAPVDPVLRLCHVAAVGDGAPVSPGWAECGWRAPAGPLTDPDRRPPARTPVRGVAPISHVNNSFYPLLQLLLLQDARPTE